MQPQRKRLGELLIAHKLLTQEQLDQALAIQNERFQPLGQILMQQGLVTEVRLLQACAMQKGVAAWHLQHDPPAADALALVPANLCRSHQLLPVRVQEGKLLLAMRDPGDIDAIDLVRNVTKLRVEPTLVFEERLLQAIEAAHGPYVRSSEAMNLLVSQAMGEFAGSAREPARVDVQVSEAEMGPVVGLVNQVLTDAIRMRASDVHIEPRRDRTEIRYRVDGQMQRVHELPAKLQPALVARVKIMAQLDIVEYRVPQDGRISFPLDSRMVDMRVSVLPNYHGQRVSIRILDKSVSLRKLTDLGFTQRNLSVFSDIISKPYGLVLVTGPTGSGKTTTLYAAINQLKNATNNIMTCEDPVEYDLDGVNQSHVNEKVGLTFAAQLRAILRQDPDIVLVGEIRDQETAETAIRAALTGHLVLSTLHCNDAPGSIARLTDMGIEPFLLSTALIGVTAQRLARQLCPHCKEQYSPSNEERAVLGSQERGDIPVVWRAIGCSHCASTGYRDRLGMHEIMPVPADAQRAIADRASVGDLRHITADAGYRPMQDDARERVLSGHTSLAEVRRTVFFDTVTPSGETQGAQVVRAA